MKDLKEIRAEIDSVDKELVSLYEKRMALTKQLAAEYNCSETCIRQRIFILRRKIKCLVKEKTKNL